MELLTPARYLTLMIIVSSLEQVPEMVATWQPGAVISILDRVEEAPVIPDLPPAWHLKIGLSMAECSMGTDLACETERVAQIITFAQRYNWQAPMLIHCQLGLTRSPAASFIIECALSPERSEEEIAMALRAQSENIDLSMMMVAQADEWLGRDGRMLEALEDMGAGKCNMSKAPLQIPFQPAA